MRKNEQAKASTVAPVVETPQVETPVVALAPTPEQIAAARAILQAAGAASKAAKLTDAEKEQVKRQVEEHMAGLTKRPCACECGGMATRTFLPGHDAKLKSRLLTEFADQAIAARRVAPEQQQEVTTEVA